MAQTDVHFEEFTTAHLDGALRLSGQAGWPHRREDWAFALGLSRGVVGVASGPLASGQVVATGLATPFGAVATVNMIIVDRNWRGRGLGRGAMNRAMALLTPEQWRLVATPDGLALYQSLEFAPAGRVLQHQGEVQAAAAPPDAVRWARAEDRDAVARLDAAATAMQRGPLLQRLTTLGRLAVLESAGEVAGYAALRPFGRGEVAGPVIATDQAGAEDLLRFLFIEREGRFLRVDTTPEAGLVGFLSRHGLARVAEGIAMRRGILPQAATPFRVFALASQALG